MKHWTDLKNTLVQMKNAQSNQGAFTYLNIYTHIITYYCNLCVYVCMNV